MVKTIEQLRNELCDLFEKLKAGEIDPCQAKEYNNTAGKIIGSIKVQLEYAALRKEAPKIDFLGGKANTDAK